MSAREQQTARVNVDDATWQAFRIRAIQVGRSVADELGRLVRNDLRHNGPIDRSAPSTAKPPPNKTPERARPAPTQRPTARQPERRPRQRLADLDLLTELPYRARPPSRHSDTADGASTL
jgi:hypothetical protein